MEYANGASGGITTTSGYGSLGKTISGSNSSLIREATEAVRKAQARVDEVTMRLRNINDEAFGAIPSKDAPGVAGIQPTASKADELRRATSALHDTLNYLEAEVNRLGQL